MKIKITGSKTNVAVGVILMIIFCALLFYIGHIVFEVVIILEFGISALQTNGQELIKNFFIIVLTLGLPLITGLKLLANNLEFFD